MESGSTVTGSRSGQKKRLKSQKANEGEDIISNLPESIISCILSFLSTKDAVRTSVLSKKWIYRWTSITELDFNDYELYYVKRNKKTKENEKQKFINFVNRTLLLTKSFDISLVIDEKYDVSLVNTWISSILNSSVKYLHVELNFELPFSALSSHFLFNNSSLEELDMKVCRCAIRVPRSYVYFGHLEILKLSGIIFTLDSPGNTEDLKLSLPVLKIFETKNCTFAKGVTLDVPLLESVFIEQYPESLSNEPHSCVIKFSASTLTKFSYSGYDYIPQCIILLDPSSAHNASANIILEQNWRKDTFPETGSRVSLLLKQFTDVKYLKFEGSKVLAQTKMAILHDFGMLSHLELGVVTIEILLGFLVKSSALKTLVFKGISKFDKELLNSAVVPYCLASTLQVVKFEGAHGHEHELCLAKFMMENGLVLERMSLSISYKRSKSKIIEEFKEKLFSFKKAFSLIIVESPSLYNYDSDSDY